MKKVHILAIPGSLRAASLNLRALRALQSLADEDARVDIRPIDDIPLYDPDRHAEGGPESVQKLKDQIAAADGLLISTPEYNYGVPGVLKNAIDWVSRPAYQSVLAHKPVAVLGASISPVGTARAQGQLKQVLLGTVSDLFPHPELALSDAKSKLGEGGEVLDEGTEQLLRRFIGAYLEWLRGR